MSGAVRVAERGGLQGSEQGGGVFRCRLGVSGAVRVAERGGLQGSERIGECLGAD